jgi:hypothetical protein
VSYLWPQFERDLREHMAMLKCTTQAAFYSCEMCNTEFEIIWPETDRLEPFCCPFCGVPLEDDDDEDGE